MASSTVAFRRLALQAVGYCRSDIVSTARPEETFGLERMDGSIRAAKAFADPWFWPKPGLRDAGTPPRPLLFEVGPGLPTQLLVVAGLARTGYFRQRLERRPKFLSPSKDEGEEQESSLDRRQHPPFQGQRQRLLQGRLPWGSLGWWRCPLIQRAQKGGSSWLISGACCGGVST